MRRAAGWRAGACRKGSTVSRRLHALIASVDAARVGRACRTDEAAARVKVGIETERGPWVASLVAAGYEVFAINPMSTARYRERHSTSKAKSDAGDAHVLAEIVRLDRAHHRPIAGDSDDGEAMKLVARSHQSMIWDRTRHVLRLRSALREYFPAALNAFDDLDAARRARTARRRTRPGPRRATVHREDQHGAAQGQPPRRRHSSARRSRPSCARPRCVNRPQCSKRSPPSPPARSALIAALNAEIDALGEVVARAFWPSPGR